MKITDALRELLFKLRQLGMVTLVDAAYWLAVRVMDLDSG